MKKYKAEYLTDKMYKIAEGAVQSLSFDVLYFDVWPLSDELCRSKQTQHNNYRVIRI